MCNLSNKSLDDLVAVYIQLRDQKAEIEAQQKEALRPTIEALSKVETEVHNRLNSLGVNSAKTTAGTAYKKMTTSVKVFDKSAFMDYVKANSAFDLLDVRANKTAIEDYMSAKQDLPPGITSVSEETVGFRRA